MYGDGTSFCAHVTISVEEFSKLSVYRHRNLLVDKIFRTREEAISFFRELQIILEVHVKVHHHNNYNGGLEVREVIELGQLDFLEVCKVLAKFHDNEGHFREEKGT